MRQRGISCPVRVHGRDRTVAIARHVVHLVVQVGDPFRARIVTDASDVQHHTQHVAEHLFVDVHVFGCQ